MALRVLTLVSADLAAECISTRLLVNSVKSDAIFDILNPTMFKTELNVETSSGCNNLLSQSAHQPIKVIFS